MSYEPYLEGDSLDYDVLYRAAQQSKTIEGLVCEIGTRRGGSLKFIIDALINTNKNIIAIDPYGNIEYQATEDSFLRLDYTNDMKNEALANIYNYVRGKGVNLIFINLEDTEFMMKYQDGVPVYNTVKQVINQYSLVFFDGPHDCQSIIDEINYFIPRSNVGTMFVFDDIQSYPHDKVHSYLLDSGFEFIEEGAHKRKASYKRK